MSFILDALKKLDSEKRRADEGFNIPEQLLVEADAEEREKGRRLSKRVSVRLGPFLLVSLLVLVSTSLTVWFLGRSFLHSELSVTSSQGVVGDGTMAARASVDLARSGASAVPGDLAGNDMPAEPAIAEDQAEGSTSQLMAQIGSPSVSLAEQLGSVAGGGSTWRAESEEGYSALLPKVEPIAGPQDAEIAPVGVSHVGVYGDASGVHGAVMPQAYVARPQPVDGQTLGTRPVATGQSFSSPTPAVVHDPSKPPIMKINMIGWRPGESRAVINMQTVYEGDMVGEVRVVKINQNNVEFEYQGKPFTVRF